jgi:hypothetical protein
MAAENAATEARDVDELKTIDDFDETSAGSEAWEGDSNFVLLTSYTDNTAGSGVVWAVQADDTDNAIAVISGLNAPVNLCYDK